MKNTQLGLETQLKDKKYIKLEHIQKLHLEMKDKAILNPREESIKEGILELENKEKWNIIGYKEVNIEIKNEMKLKTIDEINQLNELLKIENKEMEKLSIETELQSEDIEKLYIEKEENYKLKDEIKLNKGFQVNNKNNYSNINEKLILITEKNNNIIKRKNYIINLFLFIFSLYTPCFKSGKRREEKKLMISGEELLIKISKDKNGFFEDKYRSKKYLNFKESIIKKIMRNIFRNIYLIIIIHLIQRILTNNNLKIIEYKFSNITLKINGIGYKKVFTSYNDFGREYYPNMIYINGIKLSTINYSYYLNETYNFIDLIWNNSINYCEWMFYECKDITEIDLSNFDTSIVTSMWNMFWKCYSLSSLNLSNFNTSLVKNMNGMFQSCYFLSSLNLSNFDTSLVTNMRYMFGNCSSFSLLNLSNFNTSLVKDMQYMFYNCSNLEYINLINFSEKSLTAVAYMFDFVPDNIVVCINENSNKILSQIKNKNCYTIDCSDNWKIKQKKIVNKTGICIDNNNNDILYKYEYEGIYYENCLNGNLINNSTIKNCSCNEEECLSCPNIPLKEYLCTECNNDYYEIENDNNYNNYKNCYKDPLGYYLDGNIYKKCFYTCKECEINGNNITHNCIKCNDNYSYEIKIILIVILIVLIIIILIIIIIIVLLIQVVLKNILN